MNKYAMETVVGIFVAIGLIMIGYMTVKLGNVGLLESDSYKLEARFTNIAGLRIGSPVDIFGIEIGRVDQVKIDQESGKAHVTMSIKKGVNIYRDAIASIKTEGLIGDKYVSIDPGGAEELLAAGGTITETQGAIDVGDLIGKYAFGDVKGDNKQDQKGK